MSGIRIGGATALPPRRPILPMLARDNDGGNYQIWEIGNQATPYLVSSATVAFGGNNPADPMASPDVDGHGIPLEFVYSKIGVASGLVNTVQRVTWEDAANVQIATAPNAADDGSSTSVQPAWSPDGQMVVYRDTAADLADPTVGQKIKVVNRDGTGDTVLYDSMDDNWTLLNPVFSPDGAYIAFTSTEDYNPTPITNAFKYRVHVMEADGSNHTVIVGPLSGGTTDVFPLIYDTVSWMHGANTLTYLKMGATATANWEWHSIDFDGSNDTNLYTINRAGYSSVDVDPGPIYSSWLTDDSGIVTSLLNIGTGNHQISVIDGAGGGVTGLGQFVDYDGYADKMMRPLVYQQRIYFPASDALEVVYSCLENGSSLAVEFDGAADSIQFFGFRGDS